LYDNVNSDYLLLKEYENELRLEDDPRRKLKYKTNIEQLHKSANKYQTEYEDLKRLESSEPLEDSSQIKKMIQEINFKMRELLTNPRSSENHQDRLSQENNYIGEKKSFRSEYEKSSDEIINDISNYVTNVPHFPNSSFVGRGLFLEEIEKSVKSGQPVVLHGLGGVGKTQLAVKYLYNNINRFRIIWWINSENPATLASDYLGLSRELKLPESYDQREEIRAIKHWLEKNNCWLLVFDNAQEPKDLRDYLPRLLTGKVIITSRNAIWGNTTKKINVNVFDRKESIQFIIERTGEDDPMVAEKIAENLGDLPLALEQAGAYVETTGKSLKGYLNLLDRYQIDLLKDSSLTGDYPNPVAKTWEISFKQIKEQNIISANLLNLYSFFAPDNIPRSLLSKGIDYLPDYIHEAVINELGFDEAIVCLKRFSMIETTKGFLSIHRLVQAATRDRLLSEDKEFWSKVALNIIKNAFVFDKDDTKIWPECQKILPHAMNAVKYSEELNIIAEAKGKLLNQMGLFLISVANYKEALSVFNKALAANETSFGHCNEEVAKSLNGIGIILRELGNLNGAKSAFQKALKIDEAINGPLHPDAARELRNLGPIFRELGDLREARECLQKALDIDKKFYGDYDKNVAMDLNGLSVVLRVIGDLEEARKCCEKALEINESLYGKTHPSLIYSLDILGSTLKAMKDLDGAKNNFEREIQIAEANYGSNHPHVAYGLNNLGQVLRYSGDPNGANNCFKKALGINDEIYGHNHRGFLLTPRDFELP
jgi:tetratricopeptide (TPR) repeat protein